MKRAKTGPKPENGVKRVKLMRCGPWIRADVNDALTLWRDVHGVPIGRSIDAMFDYVKSRYDFKIPRKRWGTITKPKKKEQKSLTCTKNML